jgi:DNA mismatch repair protein MutS2
MKVTVPRKKEYYSEFASPDELRLRHLTIDEALPMLERYLHDAYLAGMTRVKIIHGKGEGILRLAVRRELGRHSLVRSFHPGDKWEGGEGVTVVELSEK